MKFQHISRILLYAVLTTGVSGCFLSMIQDTPPEDRVEIRQGTCGEDACFELLVEPLVLQGMEPKVGGRIKDAVNAQLLRDSSGKDAAGSARAFAESVSADYQEARAASGLKEAWLIRRIAKVLFENEKVVTVAVIANESTGGAHPIEMTYYLSFDKRTGQQIGMRQLVQPGKEQLLQKLMTFELRKERTVSPGQSLREAGFSIDDESPSLIDMASFAIVDDAVQIHYNPYQIGPYALGPIDFALSPQTAGAVFRRDSPFLAHLFSDEQALR